jgi:protein-S-isoprenylcysteine O-methyltransferase Ste14
MMIVRHVLAIIMLPVTVTIVAPAAIVSSSGALNVGWLWPAPLNLAPTIVGFLLMGLGLALIYQTVKLFATIGQGTLAPWDATRRLVVQGVYRYVRNPMISGVIAILSGEAILFGSVPLLLWCAFFFLINAIYIPLSEEPGLERRFGEDYRMYKAHVPRWVPRLKPWTLESGARINTDKHG